MLTRSIEDNELMKGRIIGLLEYFLAFFIILNSNTVWNYVYLKNTTTIITIVVLYLLVIVTFKDILLKRENFKRFIYLLLFISAYNIIFIMLNDVNRIQFIIEFVVILIGLIAYNVGLINKGEGSKLLIKISNIVVILAGISILCYLIFTVFKIIPPSSQMFYLWGGAREIPNYYNIYYVTQPITIHGMRFIRNTGVFTEAPMYAFMLTISVMCELFVRKNIKKVNLVILIVTILSTFSTTGILVSGVLIFCRAVMAINESKYKKVMRYVLIPILFICIAGIGGYFLKAKIHQGADNKKASFSVRMDDFRVGFKAWEDNMIIGHGYDQFNYVQQYMNLKLRGTDIGGSSGLMALLPEGGLYLLSMYIIPMILAIGYGIKKKESKYIIISLALLVLITVTKIQYRYIILYFLAIGWCYLLSRGEKKQINNKI